MIDRCVRLSRSRFHPIAKLGKSNLPNFPDSQTDRQTDSRELFKHNFRLCIFQALWCIKNQYVGWETKISSNFHVNMLTLRIGPFWVDEKKKNSIFFRSKNFLSAEPGDFNNGAGTKISSNFDFNMLTLRIGPFWNFFKKFSFFEKCKILQNFGKFWKIAYLWAKFSPRRRQVGQNLMRRTGKEIFCRFRISNQIFHSIYGSRDIERSLDTTLAVFGENLTFMDEYLLNEILFSPSVFCICFVLIPTV